jgi:hypothetical protein
VTNKIGPLFSPKISQSLLYDVSNKNFKLESMKEPVVIKPGEN